MDLFWQNLRYTLVSMGTAFIVKYAGAYFSAEQASSLSDLLVGALFLVGSVGWGNYVKFRTKAVPIATAARIDVPTVSGATGEVEPPTLFRGA